MDTPEERLEKLEKRIDRIGRYMAFAFSIAMALVAGLLGVGFGWSRYSDLMAAIAVFFAVLMYLTTILRL